jgi:hypothetical protein
MPIQVLDKILPPDARKRLIAVGLIREKPIYGTRVGLKCNPGDKVISTMQVIDNGSAPVWAHDPLRYG